MKLLAYLKQKRGTAVELARTLDVSTTTVHEWSTGKKRVPAERCIQIESATHSKVKCEHLRPDIDWSCLRSANKAA